MRNSEGKDNLSFEDILSIKSENRKKQIDEVYSASAEELEASADKIKDVLKGEKVIPRPKRFSSLGK